MAKPPSYNESYGKQGHGDPPPYPSYAGYPTSYPPAGQPAGYPSSYPPAGQPAGYPTSYPPAGQPAGYPSAYPPAGQPAGYPSSYPPPGQPVVVGSGGDGYSGEAPGFMRSFEDKAIRRAFVRRVYLILLTQLGITVGIISLFVFHDGVRGFVQRNFGLYIASYVTFIVVYLVLVCCTGVRRKHPWNIVLLSVFTLALAYLTGTISSFYDTKIVFIALAITCAVCLGITIFSIQTKIDITSWGLYLFVASIVLFVFGIICIFTYSKIMNTIYGGLIALLFSLFLAFDTQQIVGGRKHELEAEEYVYGALVLYLDITYIFWGILTLMGSGD